jgi:predicted transposase YdaD
LSKLGYLVDKGAEGMSAAERWAFYFRYLTDRGKRQKINEIIEYEEGIAMASEVLITISRDEVERARLLSEYKYEVDMQSHIVNAKREGERIGRQEGEQIGERRGRQEGEQRKAAEILKLIDSGCAPEQIREHLKPDNR